MFWTNNYVSSQSIEALLNKEDVTLQELMNEEDILQECKSQNKKLVEYLTRPEVMEELVTLTTKEPPMDIEERCRYKYPNVACELLTCDVPTLNEKLAGDASLLAKLYSFMETDEPLNPLLASFFSKTIGALIARTSDQVLEFLKNQQHCVDLLLQHLETSAIMDLVLKLVTQIEGSDMRQNILNWLDSQQLVQRLVKLLSPTSKPAKHANAAQLLCNIITVSRKNQHSSMERTDPDPILNTLESTETVSLLLETVLYGEKVESSIVGGIYVLLTLLGQKPNNVLNEDDPYQNNAITDAADNEQRLKISNAVLPFLEQIHKILLDPPNKAAVKTTAGILEVPLGNTRLHIANLVVALLSTENLKIHETLAELGTFQTLLDLFFKYSWNNFLHTQVQQCLELVINCNYEDGNDSIYNHIFMKCKLLDRILEAWDKNESKQNKENGKRQGYMGHLIIIANNIVTQCEKSYRLENFLKTNLSSETLGKWENLIRTQLVEINKTYQMFPCGQPTDLPNSDENPNEYGSYSEQNYMQLMYPNYMRQQMTPQYIENFAYRDDEFNHGEEALHNSVDQLTTVAFNLSEEDLDKREDMFNEMCQQKQKIGLEDSSGAAEWGDEGESTVQTVVDKWVLPSRKQPYDSSSSDEEDEDPREMHDTQMEIDSNDPWDGTAEPSRSSTAIPEVNPWEATPSEPVESTGWANFDNFESTLNIENAIVLNNAPCPETTKETNDAATCSKEEESVKNSKTSTENSGAGGDGNNAAEVDSGTTLNAVEANENNQSKNENVYVAPVADKNANPSDHFDVVSEPDCTKHETINVTECTKKLVEKEESSSEKETSTCTSQNGSSSEATLTTKDSK